MDEMDLKLCPFHDSPLQSTHISSKCNACYEDHHDHKQGYKCSFCDFYVHEGCINTTIPSRHKHPLNFGYNDKICCLCQNEGHWGSQNLNYVCSQCSFCICIPCARKPLIFNPTKAHEHELHHIPIKLSFTCDACGVCSTDYPCMCHQCCFIIHRECIFLPRVIYINRHDHRISHVSSLGHGEWICGVCHEHVNGECGAYSCLVCSYVVHSNCATRRDIWDQRELEGVPEEDEETVPFEMIDQNMIKHFSHEHNLKVSKSSLRLEEGRHCYACTLPFYSELCYICTQCDFILHHACANLPLKKRHAVSSRKITLDAEFQHENYIVCEACNRYCTGFSYTDSKFNIKIDVRCASVDDAFKHESHPHWLFQFTNTWIATKCGVCNSIPWMYLRCTNKDECAAFTLCFRCATLPASVRHKYDDHPLSLCYGEGYLNSTYCCGICEEEIYPKSGFYGCSDCGFTLHTECVFNNLIHPKPGYSLVMGDKGTFNLLLNNRLSRPICYLCKNRCMGDLVLNDKVDSSKFMCSSCGFPGFY